MGNLTTLPGKIHFFRPWRGDPDQSGFWLIWHGMTQLCTAWVGKRGTFPDFSSSIIFSHFFLTFFLNLVLRVGKSPTREGPVLEFSKKVTCTCACNSKTLRSQCKFYAQSARAPKFIKLHLPACQVAIKIESQLQKKQSRIVFLQWHIFSLNSRNIGTFVRCKWNETSYF